MKQFKTYTAPQAELIEMEAQSVFCTSGNNPTPSAPGAGVNGMNAGASHGW